MGSIHRNVGGVVLAVVVATGLIVAPSAATAATVGSVSATPTTGLGWRTNVTVTVTGAPALATLSILECNWDIEPDGGCSTVGTPTTDAAGSVVAVVTTRRSVHDEEGGGDCWSPRALSCDLAVFAPDVGLIGARIPIVDDHIHEGTERFRMQLDKSDHGRLADANATIWIGDDD